ncbi:MAG TPA: tRNA epoxyqueuosine(34) reductase QueG [Gemmatimonadaceae bacterium]|nr:tRNA epoxyqueuosine(34) reductase QueG [Gemmatimonadaceae bacterium]
MTDARSLEERVKARALEIGFDLVGIARLGPAESHDAYTEWLRHGFAGEMSYLERGAEKRRDTRLPFPAAQCAVVVGLDYGGRQPAGPVARYARGDDYHEIMTRRLDELHRWIADTVGRDIAGKPYVDTGPILERELASKAGLGWIGKNTMLVNPKRGSFFFIGALLLDLNLEADAPFDSDRCGRCTRCLDACPTAAFVAPRVLDANRCISYLTIEHRSEIPEELQPLMGELLYGCDVCQDVCPWNVRFSSELKEPAFVERDALAGKSADTLARDIAAMSEEDFPSAFARSPMKRAKLRGLKRNAAVVLRNLEADGTSDS